MNTPIAAHCRWLGWLAALVALITISAPAEPFVAQWSEAEDQVWVGADFWANRLQDWQVAGGRLECVQAAANKPFRTVHLLTRRLAGARAGGFEMRVLTGLASGGRSGVPADAFAGFLFAAAPTVDYRAAALVHHSHGPDGGWMAGMTGNGALVFQDNTRPWAGAAGAAGGIERGVSRRNWRLAHVDSADPESGAGENAFDGDPLTVWHTHWREGPNPHPHGIHIDMGAPVEVAALGYLPRQQQATARIADYALYLSLDGEDWGEPVAQGTFPNTADEQIVPVPPTRARHFRLVALSEPTGRPSATAAEVFIYDPQNLAERAQDRDEAADEWPGQVELRLRGEPRGDRYALILTANDPESGEVLKTIEKTDLPAEALAGSLALVSHPGAGAAGRPGARFWFRRWHVRGDKIAVHADRHCGPILSAQYTVSRQVLKLTAQFMPLADGARASLHIQRDDGTWQAVGAAAVASQSWTATFQVADWDCGRDWPFQVRLTSGTGEPFQGLVRRDPVDKDEIVVAGFTGNHNTVRGVEGGGFPWNGAGLWFPHTDLVRQVDASDPDLLFFSGDQVYEGGSPTAPERGQWAELDYMYKWYLWCWAFRDLTCDRPSVVIPDDHDVFQGNLWGAGGRAIDKDDKGGYVLPAEFVKMVERTQTSNLPDPWDPTPVEQGIGVYYGALEWGRIGFAILEDRKFKSGPDGLVPPTTSGRADHVIDPDFDPRTADAPGAVLLGERQLRFLDAWVGDWKGQDMKVALSQTVFANAATHHGPNLSYLVADYDSNGWPQSGRARALSLLRKAFAFHLCGDQHLATIIHHGVDDWNDAIWSFCVPSVANFYPRAWSPPAPPRKALPGLAEHTGEYLDGLGNHLTVYAHTNPRPMGHEPRALHDRMPGHGIIRLNRADRTITMECWPRFADPANPEDQYEGWPRTIAQTDNYGRTPAFWLPEIHVVGLDNPVFHVVDDSTGELVYALRPGGAVFQPWTFSDHPHTVRISDPEAGRVQSVSVRKPAGKDWAGALEIPFGDRRSRGADGRPGPTVP